MRNPHPPYPIYERERWGRESYRRRWERENDGLVEGATGGYDHYEREMLYVIVL